jgi:hypothetical protein
MTYSPLTDEKMPPTGLYRGSVKWQARPANVRINGLNVHHHAATGTGGIVRLTTSSDPASANYIIRTNGRLIGSVPEEFRAWTTSSYAADDDKITVEIQNETGAPTWRVSAAAMQTLIRLFADIARRYQFPPTRAHIIGHQEYGIATACPGPYLLPRLGDVALAAAKIHATATDVAESDTFHLRYATRHTTVTTEPGGGSVVAFFTSGDKLWIRDDSARKVDNVWYVSTTAGNWVRNDHTSVNRPFHTREVTEETHVYEDAGANMTDRLLAVGTRITIWDGSGTEVNGVWYVETTEGNWVRSAKTQTV